MLLTAMMLRSQRAIVQRFEQAGVTSAGVARTAQELELKPGLAWHQLVGHVVLRCPGEGRYYLDLANWERLRRQRRRHAWAIGAAVVLLLALLFWLRAAAG
jgi:hypothetical protein